MSYPVTVKLSGSGAAALADATAAATGEPSSSDTRVPLYDAAAASAPCSTPLFICNLEFGDEYRALTAAIQNCFASYVHDMTNSQAVAMATKECATITGMIDTTLPSLPAFLQPYVTRSF